MEFDKEMIKQLIAHLQEQCGLFQGRYDAKHGKISYMYGIATALEYISVLVSEEYYQELIEEFYQNIEKCQVEAGLFDVEEGE